MVYDFALIGKGITQHPAAIDSANILLELMARDRLNQATPAELVTGAMREELLDRNEVDLLRKAETERNHPAVQEHGRVIDADTRLVVVDEHLVSQIVAHQKAGFKELLLGSVQLWATKINKLRLEPLGGRDELYAWRDKHDPEFLGIMAGVLRTDAFLAAGGGVV